MVRLAAWWMVARRLQSPGPKDQTVTMVAARWVTNTPATWAFGYPAKGQRKNWRPSVAGYKEHARGRQTCVTDISSIAGPSHPASNNRSSCHRLPTHLEPPQAEDWRG